MNINGENIRYGAYFVCEQLQVRRRPFGYVWLPDIAAKIADSGNIQHNGIIPKTGAVCFIFGLYLLPASRRMFVFIKRSMCFSYSKTLCFISTRFLHEEGSYP
jgi:NADH:ubiquinone oxidoreductase subunit 4 (subunit M)